MINETVTGKVDVELFSVDMQKSFTMEMLRTGLICSSVSEKAFSGESLKQDSENHTKTGILLYFYVCAFFHIKFFGYFHQNILVVTLVKVFSYS